MHKPLLFFTNLSYAPLPPKVIFPGAPGFLLGKEEALQALDPGFEAPPVWRDYADEI